MPVEKKAHCKYGHPMSGDNLIIYKPPGLVEKCWRRICKECRLRRSKEQKERLVAGIKPGKVGAPRTEVCPKGHTKSLENLVISYAKRTRGRGEEYWYPVHICKTCQGENATAQRAKDKARRAERKAKLALQQIEEKAILEEQRNERFATYPKEKKYGTSA